MSDNPTYPQCGFCAAEHPNPNEPGACVMFWQSVADRYRDALHKIAFWSGNEADLPSELQGKSASATKFFTTVEPIRIARAALAQHNRD